MKTIKLEKYTEQNKLLGKEVQDLAEKFNDLNHQKIEFVDKMNLMNEIERLKKQNKNAKREYDDLTSRFDCEKRDHEETLVEMKTLRDNNENLNQQVQNLKALEDKYTLEIKKITEKLNHLQSEYNNCSEKLQKQIDETKKQSDLKDGAWAIIDESKKSESAQNKAEVTDDESQSISVSCQTEFSKKPNTIEALDGNSASQIEDTNNQIGHERRLSNFTMSYPPSKFYDS